MSILNSIKQLLGMTEDYSPFDNELILHINSVFMILHNLGVGPDTPYKIVDSTNTWDEFIDSKDTIEAVKTYVYLKTRLIFDPPTSSIVLESYNRIISELEWRLNVIDNKEEESDE